MQVLVLERWCAAAGLQGAPTVFFMRASQVEVHLSLGAAVDPSYQPLFLLDS